MKLQYFKNWDKFVAERNRLFSDLRYENNEEKFVWALFARISALSDEIIFLVRNSRYTSTQILMRSALETYIDLKCLVEDPEFIDVLMQAERKSEIKYLNNFELSNQYYGDQSKENIESKLKELNKLNDKSKNLNVFQKFEKAKELHVHRTIYNSLCRFSHGSITALASKNFENDQIKLNSSISDSEFVFVLSSSINLAIAATVLVSTKLEINETEITLFKEFLTENNEIAKQFA